MGDTDTSTYTPHLIHNGTTQQNVLSSTSNTLHSLVSFYQQQRMWVYRMRAMEACTPQLTDEGPDQLHQGHPESTPDFSMGSTVDPQEHLEEPSSSNRQTRWMRRKKEFNLRLEGIRSMRINPLQLVQGERVEKLRPREQILEMFEKMMEARMESCQRVNKLVVEEANRANTHNG